MDFKTTVFATPEKACTKLGKNAFLLLNDAAFLVIKGVEKDEVLDDFFALVFAGLQKF